MYRIKPSPLAPLPGVCGKHWLARVGNLLWCRSCRLTIHNCATTEEAQALLTRSR